MRVSQHFECRSQSVPAARQFASDALDGLPPQAIDQIALVVSEVATNAILHSQSDFEVRIDRDERQVHVAVVDNGEERPKIQWPTPADKHGRGLHIIRQLADHWGVSWSDVRQEKTVWATFVLSQIDGTP